MSDRRPIGDRHASKETDMFSLPSTVFGLPSTVFSLPSTVLSLPSTVLSVSPLQCFQSPLYSAPSLPSYSALVNMSNPTGIADPNFS